MIQVELHDELRALIDRVTDKWLLDIMDTNPAILSMFRDKNLKPARSVVPWSGEFAGKYLTGCAQIYAITGSRELKEYCDAFIKKLISYQEPNGYLGPFDKEHQFTGTNAFFPDPINNRVIKEDVTWDLWGHYHIMYGLLLWGDILGKDEVFKCVYRIADLMMNWFYGEDGKRMVDIGCSEMNLAPYHIFALLYNRTGKQEYLDFARKIEIDTEDERAGDYMTYALSGMEFYQCPKPRWESLHIIIGYAEMYRATGDKKYLDSIRQIVYSILKTDVHNTGAFSTNERAIGNPFEKGRIETCCVVAFNALVTELNELEPSVHLADMWSDLCITPLWAASQRAADGLPMTHPWTDTA